MISEITPAFDCRMCGECCRGSGGIVLKLKDQERLAAHFKLDRETFLAKYGEKRGAKHYLKTKADGFCIFFGNNCEVHQVKPDVCRAWPFFHGNMVDEVSWAMASEACPGIRIDAGHEAFVREGREYLEKHGLLNNPGGGEAETANALRP